jgi:hypothetical protein
MQTKENEDMEGIKSVGEYSLKNHEDRLMPLRRHGGVVDRYSIRQTWAKDGKRTSKRNAK